MTSSSSSSSSALKCQLAMEISRIPHQRPLSCSTHTIKPRSRFVDCYLVLRAYTYLTDKAKRHAFNLDRLRRKNTACYDCDQSYKRTNCRLDEPHSALILREIGKRMAEEARVIENCLRINRKTRNGYPVFSPSNYVNQGYPHQPRRDYRLENAGLFGRVSVPGFHRQVKCETPVFELRKDCVPLNVKFTC